ncbi:MAG: PAS domain S-box protein [Rubrivivax sp.]|nr:PAS domain S-box protein [Rubrivivax sp.]
MLMLLALVIAVAMGLLAHLSSQRLHELALAEQQQWVAAVARAAAGQVAPSLSQGDADGALQVLRDVAAMPAVGRVQVRDGSGRTLFTLTQSDDGRVVRHAEDAGAPADGSGPVAEMSWAGVGPAGALGTVGISHRGHDDRQALSSLHREMLGAVALVGLVMLLSVSLFVNHAMQPLVRLARFSRELSSGGVRQVHVQPRSAEVAELADALNHAAATMHEQVAALQAHDAEQAALLNAVPDALIGLDRRGRVALASPGVRAVFGVEPAEAAGLALEDLLPGITAGEAEARTLQGLYMRSTRSHVARFEMQARRIDGTPFPAEVSLSRIETAEGPRYAALVRDMTEARMASDLAHLYGRALECTSNGVVISDVSLPGSPVFYANPAFSRITGYEPSDAVGRNCSFLQLGDTEQPEIAELAQAVAGRRSAQVVLRNYRKDGTLFFNELAIAPVTETDGTVRHYVGVLNDVTERERSRMAIAERGARLNAVFELSPDGFVVFDGEDRLVYCNGAFIDMVGWRDTPDLDGLQLQEFDARLLAQCDPAQLPQPLADELAGDGEPAPRTLVVQRPERRVLARLVRRQRDGHVETILFFRDVTRETEVDRMKSEFLTTAAHELRTPMVSVFGFTELLLRRQVPEERRRDMLETIHRQAKLLIHMVNELLDLARIEARQGKDIRLSTAVVSELVEASLEPLRVGPRAHDLVVDLADADVTLCVDRSKTEQALTNVLSNAVKYSPEGGPIVVTTRRGELNGLPAIGVRVSDRGIGMTPEQLGRVFERFYRADPSGNIPGTGLGLCLVKEIVEMHEGRVDIASEQGKGTSVTLWWPVWMGADEAGLAVAPAAQGLG